MSAGNECRTKLAGEYLDHEGNAWTGRFTVVGGKTVALGPTIAMPELSDKSYLVAALPVDFHCHGAGCYDFSEFSGLDLDGVEAHLASIGLDCVLTTFVSQRTFPKLLKLLSAFQEGVGDRFKHVLGFAIEGPVLRSIGGTPVEGAWWPTRREWFQLAAFSGSVVRYVVLSPDAIVPTCETGSPASHVDRIASLEEVIDIITAAGIAPAFGHFSNDDPQHSAMETRRLLDQIAQVNARLRIPTPVFSDHLFNDMPTKVRYAWRTASERASKKADIERLALESWTLESLDQTLGPVPATLIKAAADGELIACMNFDGDHVDLAVCHRILRLVGADNLIAITDRVEANRLAGRDLLRSTENTLLYRETGPVAAGTQTVLRQQDNMRHIGLTETEIWRLTAINANIALRRAENTGVSFVYSELSNDSVQRLERLPGGVRRFHRRRI